MAQATSVHPKTDLDTIIEWATANLTRVIAIDSQSDEESESIPSTEGQRRLSNELRGYFEGHGLSCEQDDFANLIASVPARGVAAGTSPLAFMVHIDTSKGTTAVDELCLIPAWDGGRVPYPENDRLQVSTETFPETQLYVGQDVLHGPGKAPVGFDDKLGVAQLMTLVRVLAENPALPHPELLLIFRPDEEIGRMAAVVGLAEILEKRGVRHGYTVDGLKPFEINVENFNASRGSVRVTGEPLDLPSAAVGRRLKLTVYGCKSHGATAKAEGYLNATVVYARLLPDLDAHQAVPVGFSTDAEAEVNAEVSFLLRGDDAEALDAVQRRVVERFEEALLPHAFKGAHVEIAGIEDADPAVASDALTRAGVYISQLMDTPGVAPILSEESDGFEGYSNPYGIEPDGDGFVVSLRLRDFKADGLRQREAHAVRVADAMDGPKILVDIEQQYVNMGPALESHPELVRWAADALGPLDITPEHLPIRGGTGVDPFLERGVPVANLGTGYFAPESEKELTSKQTLGRTVLWLTHLVQVVAHEAGETRAAS